LYLVTHQRALVHSLLLLKSLINSNPCPIRLPWAPLPLATVFANWHCPCLRYQSDCHVHPTCYSYWLANSFSQFLPLDACASVDVLNLYYCVIVLTWLVCCIYPYCLQWVLVIFILLTSLSAHGFHLVLLTCIVLFYYCIDLYCIVLNCVLAYTPQSTVSTGFTLLLTHMFACVCISLAGRMICLYCHCVLLLAYWHWRLLLIICLLPQLLRAVAPALTLINIF